MQSVRLVAATFALVISSTAQAAPPTDAERNTASVKETIAKIDGILRPLREKPANAWWGGRIPPFDFETSPSDWYRKKHWHKENMAAHVRTLLRAGVCRADATALEALYDLEWRVFGLGLFQMESLYLQHRAALIDLKLPFHERYRRRYKYTPEMSEEPQREMRINYAFGEARPIDALEFVPRFQKLCR